METFNIKHMAFIVCLSCSTQAVLAASNMPSPVGRVLWIKGTLKAVMPNHEERSLKKLSIIYKNDRLITDANSQAQVVFSDNTLMTFQKNTEFEVTQYQFTGQSKSSSDSYIMSLVKGGFRTVTGLIGRQNPSKYEIRTPVATIGVRGTDYAVQIEKHELLMNRYDGSPCMRNTQGAVCLSFNNPYGKVAVNQKPMLLLNQPQVFKVPLEVKAAKIEPFQGATGTPAAGATSTTSPASSGTSSGSSSNTFCITTG